MSKIMIDSDRLTTVLEKMCDDYCYWPVNASSDRALEMHCEECPLNNISCEDYWEERGAE